MDDSSALEGPGAPSSLTQEKMMSSSLMLGAEGEALVVVEGATSAAVFSASALVRLGGSMDVSGGG